MGIVRMNQIIGMSAHRVVINTVKGIAKQNLEDKEEPKTFPKTGGIRKAIRVGKIYKNGGILCVRIMTLITKGVNCMIRRKATIKFRPIALPLTLVAVQITKHTKGKRIVCKCMIKPCVSGA